jgi:hypothetical protein
MRILPARKAAITWFLFCGNAMGQNSAASEALFQRGLADMAQGKYVTACPSLRDSYKLEPRAGTMFTVAECEFKSGRIAASATSYSDYLDLVSDMPIEQRARHAERIGIAQKRVNSLRPKIPLLTLLPPRDLVGEISIELDGVALGHAAIGVELPVDPGEHVVVTQFPGAKKHEQRFRVEVGERRQLPLEFANPSSLQQPVEQTAIMPVPTQETRATTPVPVASYVAGGIGIVGIVVGSVAGVMSLKQKSIVDDNCLGLSCNSNGKAAADSGRTFATVSTVGFGVGVVGLATGFVFWLAPPKNATTTPRAAREWAPRLSVSERRSALVSIGGVW